MHPNELAEMLDECEFKGNYFETDVAVREQWFKEHLTRLVRSYWETVKKIHRIRPPERRPIAVLVAAAIESEAPVTSAVKIIARKCISSLSNKKAEKRLRQMLKAHRKGLKTRHWYWQSSKAS